MATIWNCPSCGALVGQDKYRLALEEMGVPQVVNAWQYQEVTLQVAFGKLGAEQAGLAYVLPAGERFG